MSQWSLVNLPENHQAAPSFWATPPTSSAPESERPSATWQSTKWYSSVKVVQIIHNINNDSDNKAI